MSATNPTQESIFEAIDSEGFTAYTLQLIDNYTSDILNGRTNISRFNQQEHAGLCCAGSVLIGAYIICDYARRHLEANNDVTTSQASSTSSIANWIIDEEQEKLVQQWAGAKKLWIPDSERWINSSFGPKIAQGAEAKVYYRSGSTSVIKERTSIYSTLGKAFEAIILHNSLFPDTEMNVIGFTRDSDGLFRTILTQPCIGCERLATKEEIDNMVAKMGFHSNQDGNGVNYLSDRLHLEDMHPANVFIDKESGMPVCIDCIVKFIKK